MTSVVSSGSSRLLVGFCCFVTLISVVFYSVGFMRLAYELKAHNERILALEENQQKTTIVPVFKSLNEDIPVANVNITSSSAQKRNPRDAESSKGDNGVLAPEIQEQITKSVHAATQKICTNQSQICVQGPPGPQGPQGKGEGGRCYFRPWDYRYAGSKDRCPGSVRRVQVFPGAKC
ncbi:uncharacterized protein LOC144654012 [Oculina patagonica]